MLPKSEHSGRTERDQHQPDDLQGLAKASFEIAKALKQVSSPLGPGLAAPVGKVAAARAAVRQFLAAELEAREIRITKIAPTDHGGTGWTAEAEILAPNLEIKMLGLPLTQEVLERERYTLELEADLTVRSYENRGPDE
ncbi:MAG: hypothetical protein HYS06_03605 [Methylocystis sp.]|nr:hypothetical protein [Methylocystis sp.]